MSSDASQKARRSRAIAAARLLSGADGTPFGDILQQLGILDVLGVFDEYQATRPSGETGSVGIWEPVSREGAVYYERSLRRSSEWWSWANVKRIMPKGEKKRVLFVGESAARGFFYDPAYTPAQVLEHMLGE